MPGPVVIRSSITRAFRAAMCGALILALAWAIQAEITTQYVETGTRAGWMAATIAVEVVMLIGLQRLWVVCLIVEETRVVVRNFRGDIRLRRSEIKSVDQANDYVGFGVEIRLKTGDKIRLDGLTWPTPAPVEKALADIRYALGMAPADVTPTPPEGLRTLDSGL